MWYGERMNCLQYSYTWHYMQASGLLQAPVALYLHGQSHHHSMDKWMDGSQTNADATNDRKMPLLQNKSWSFCYRPHSLITILTELCLITEGRKEGGRGGRTGRTQLRIFWGEPYSLIQNLYQELLVVYTILLWI